MCSRESYYFSEEEAVRTIVACLRGILIGVPSFGGEAAKKKH